MRKQKTRSTIIALGVCLAFLMLIMLSILPQRCNADPTEYHVYFHDDTPANPETQKPESICPKTLMNDKCLTCHVSPEFGLREPDPDRYNRYPVFHMKVRGDIGYYLLTDIDSEDVKDFLEYLDRLLIKKAVIEIHSYGGPLFECARIIGYMQAWEKAGGTVETRLYGMAFSAGFAVFVSGTMGHRYVSPIAECMWHELITGEMFAIKSPADKEDEARVLRHLQDTTNNWIVSRSKISKEELDRKIRKKEFWINGSQAVEYGFADGFIGE